MILVTGGCGYIGSELVPLLTGKGYEVRVLDNFSSGSVEALKKCSGSVEIVEGDVRDVKTVKRAAKDAEAIVHLAAITGADTSFKIREAVFDVNYKGTKAVLEAASRHCEKLVFASSCNIYGRQQGVITETTPPNPVNPYAESKLMAENLCRKYSEEQGLDIVSLRTATLYGYAPGIRYNLVVNLFIKNAIERKPIIIYGDGTNWRPFIHVRDAARAFLLALEYKNRGYEVFNSGSTRENYTIAQIASTISNFFYGIKINYLRDKYPGPSYRVDFTKIEEKMGFRCEYTLRSGVMELIYKLAGPVLLQKYSEYH